MLLIHFRYDDGLIDIFCDNIWIEVKEVKPNFFQKYFKKETKIKYKTKLRWMLNSNIKSITWTFNKKQSAQRLKQAISDQLIGDFAKVDIVGIERRIKKDDESG